MKMNLGNAYEGWETEKILTSRLKSHSWFCLNSSAKTTDQLFRIARSALHFLSQSPGSLLSENATYCCLFAAVESFYSSLGLNVLKLIYYDHRGLNMATKVVSVFLNENIISMCDDSDIPGGNIS